MSPHSDTLSGFRSGRRDRMVVGLITTDVVSSNLDQGVQHYVIKFVGDLRHFGGFLRVLRFRPPIKLTGTITLKYC